MAEAEDMLISYMRALDQAMQGGAPTNNRERQFAARRAMSGRDPSLSPADREAVARRAAISEENNQVVERGVGEIVLGQPIRAGRAIGEAYDTPSIANLTAAGAHTALAAFRPMTAGAFAVGGMGAAAASDLAEGLVSKASAQQPSARARAANAERAAARERANLLKTESATAAEAEQRRIAALDREEYDAAVRRAEAEKNAILADKPKRFGDTAVGEVYNKLGMIAPGVIAAGMGGVSRLGAAALGYNGKIANYAFPMAVGAGTGGVSANWPLGHDLLFEPAANPERRAYEAYARELPPTHPRKQEWTDYALSRPEANPARNAASAEFYDPVKFMERTGLGVAEGVLGGLAGSEIVNILRNPVRAVRGNTAPGGGGGGGGNTGGGQGGNGNVPPHPLANTQGRYPEPGSDGREFVRRAYRQEYSRAFELPSPTAFNRTVRAEATAAGGSLPNLQSRVRETNAAVREFEAANGRPPMTDADWQSVFRMTRTLSMAAPAAGLAGYYGATEQPANALLQYRAGNY